VSSSRAVAAEQPGDGLLDNEGDVVEGGLVTIAAGNARPACLRVRRLTCSQPITTSYNLSPLRPGECRLGQTRGLSLLRCLEGGDDVA